MGRQLFASAEIDGMPDDDQSDIRLFLISALLLRLGQDENFAFGDWDDEKLQLNAGRPLPRHEAEALTRSALMDGRSQQ